MSMFLPEGSTGKLDTGVIGLTPPDPMTTEDDIALMERVFAAAASRPNAIPQTFMAYLVDFIQTSNLNIPIGQIFGFSQFTASTDSINTSETTPASVSYGDLATVGPVLTLPDGQYLFLYGALNNQGAGATAFMGIKINGTEAADADAVQWITNGNFIPGARGITKRLSNNGSNTVTARYRTSVSGTPAGFANRWLVALKYANL